MPSTEIEAAVRDGDSEADSAEDGLGVCRHIVQAFEGMLVVGTAFGNQAVEDGLHIGTHIGVAVLVDGETATGVLGEDVDEARAG